MERYFTTWTVSPRFGLRNNFLTPQTPNIIFNEVKDQLRSPKFLRLGGFFSFGVRALPEEVLWPEDVPKNDPSLNSYMQVAGVHEAMTVEVRVSDGSDSYTHCTVAREPVADPEAWTWARLSMSSSQGYKLISDFNYDREPVLDPPYTAQDVAQELEAFPREPNAIPDWMRIGG